MKTNWVDDPPSQEIADILNATSATECPHGWSRCISQCGVRRVWAFAQDGRVYRWVVISVQKRAAFRNLPYPDNRQCLQSWEATFA